MTNRPKSDTRLKTPKVKPPLTPGEMVSTAACRAQSVFATWATAAGIELDETARSVIRLCVVYAVFRRFASLQGIFVFESDDAPFHRIGLPDDDTLRAAFRAEIDSIDVSVGCSEFMGHALEPLASKEGQRARGAHFTPRSMAGPIVAKTLEPLLKLVEPERTLELRVCDPAVGGGVFLLELVSQLAERLIECGRCSDIYVARRLVALHCAYGVDVDPVSVECARLALWLECRASPMPWSWLDANIRTGDALVGLSGEQLKTFQWNKDPKKDWPLDPALTQLHDRAVQLGRDARAAQLSALATFAEIR